MASTTQIEWTDATWNPVTGCTKITRGCDFCYAERFSERFRGVPSHPFENGFDLKLRPERLTQPLSWRQQRRIFVNSMSDLFHKDSFPVCKRKTADLVRRSCFDYAGMTIRNQLSRNDLSFLDLLGCFSFRSALASIWRM